MIISFIKKLIFINIIFIFISCTSVVKEIEYVETVQYIQETELSDSYNYRLMSEILDNQLYYIINKWFPDNFDATTDLIIPLDFKGVKEHNIRPNASAALALAVRSVIDDSSALSNETEVIRYLSLSLVKSLIISHKSIKADGWGNEWQSPLWASFTAYAGLLLRDYLSPDEKEDLIKMVLYEAAIIVNRPIPYYKSNAGIILYPGDSKFEENSWNAQLMTIALLFLKDKTKQELYFNHTIKLLLSSSSKPGDNSLSKLYQEKPLSFWVDGSNIEINGAVINHDRIHPDYMACLNHLYFSSLVLSEFSISSFNAINHNSLIIYQAMTDYKFKDQITNEISTIYQEDGTIFYPQENDWGTGRRINFAIMDLQAIIFEYDNQSTIKARYWFELHSKTVLEMQNRNLYKNTYISNLEDNYPGKEQWVAVHASMGVLTIYYECKGNIKFSNKGFKEYKKELFNVSL